MNYRHAFHAGNFADVVKHATLVLILEHLKLKPKPFRVLDTHAGTGVYDLAADQASRTGEWREGIGRLLGEGVPPLPGAAAPLLARYLEVVSGFNADGRLARYPGSPLIVRRLLRPVDRLVVNELHPEDGAALAACFRGDRKVTALAVDGYAAVRSQLPPKERRGLVLIDPPFEVPGELDRLITALSDADRRFATGTLMIWYPLKDVRAVARFKRRVAELGLAKLLVAEVLVEREPAAERLYGSGLLILNPPFTLAGQLAVLLAALAERLARGAGAEARIDWLAR